MVLGARGAGKRPGLRLPGGVLPASPGTALCRALALEPQARVIERNKVQREASGASIHSAAAGTAPGRAKGPREASAQMQAAPRQSTSLRGCPVPRADSRAGGMVGEGAKTSGTNEIQK